MPWIPCFRTIAGEFGSPRSRGRLLREWPVYSRQRCARRISCIPSPETVRGISGSPPGSGSFSFARGKCGRTDPLGQAGTQGLSPGLCSPILCRAAYGLGFFRVAWRISRTVRSARRTASADGLGEGRVAGLQLDRDGTLWAATEGGLSRVKDGHVATLTSKNGLPCDTRSLGDGRRRPFVLAVHGLRPGAHCPARVGRVGRRSEADHPDHVFDSSDGVRSHAIPQRLQSACRQVRGWKIVVPAWRRRQRHRSASPSLQQTPAAGAHRANHRRPQDLRRNLRTCACPR